MIQDDTLKLIAQQMIGMTEEDMDNVTPEMEEELLNATNCLGKYRLVAEVVSAKYCTAGLKPGQKYVVEGIQQIDPAKSTAPLCLGALEPLAQKAQVLMDRIYHNGEVTKHLRGFSCSDPGLDMGGLGGVKFKIIIEEI